MLLRLLVHAIGHVTQILIAIAVGDLSQMFRDLTTVLQSPLLRGTPLVVLRTIAGVRVVSA
jgi:hypothetical protein